MTHIISIKAFLLRGDPQKLQHFTDFCITCFIYQVANLPCFKMATLILACGIKTFYVFSGSVEIKAYNGAMMA